MENNELFLEKYRIDSIRLKNWDYASPGYYFVTICIDNREHFFGNVKNGIMYLSKIGQIVLNNWYKIPDHFKYSILHEFMIMPNHLHGIVQILWNDNPLYGNGDGLCNDGDGLCNDGDGLCRDAINRVSTENNQYVSTENNENAIKKPSNNKHKNQQSQGGITGHHNPMLQPNSLSQMMRSFKSVCTNQIRKNHLPLFQWQERFFDHIVRNDKDLKRIQNYIIRNPQNWKCDRNNEIDLWM